MKMPQLMISVRSEKWIHYSLTLSLFTRVRVAAKPKEDLLSLVSFLMNWNPPLILYCSNTKYPQGKCLQPLRQCYGALGLSKRLYGTLVQLPWACHIKLIIRYLMENLVHVTRFLLLLLPYELCTVHVCK